MSTFDTAMAKANDVIMETFGDLRQITKGDFADTVMTDFWVVPASVSAAGESFGHPQPMLGVLRRDVDVDLSNGAVKVGDKTYRIIRPSPDQKPESEWVSYELGLPK